MPVLNIVPQTRLFTADELRQTFVKDAKIVENTDAHSPVLLCSFENSARDPFLEANLQIIYHNPSHFGHPLHQPSTEQILGCELFNHGYEFRTTLRDLFPHFTNAKILFGDFDEHTQQFQVYNTGLEYYTSQHALATIVYDTSDDQRATAMQRIMQHALYHKTVATYNNQAIDVLIFPKTNMAFTVNGHRKQYSSRWVSRAVSEYYSNLTKMLQYDCIDNELNYWNAWVIDISGINIMPDKILSNDPRRPQICTNYWYDLQPDYLCASCYRNPDGNIKLACQRVSKGRLSKMQYLQLDAIRKLVSQIYPAEIVPEWAEIPH